MKYILLAITATVFLGCSSLTPSRNPQQIGEIGKVTPADTSNAKLTCEVMTNAGGTCYSQNGATQQILSTSIQDKNLVNSLSFATTTDPKSLSGEFYTLFDNATSPEKEKMIIEADINPYNGMLSILVAMDRKCKIEPANGQMYCKSVGSRAYFPKKPDGTAEGYMDLCGLAGEHGGLSVVMEAICSYK